MTKILGEPSRIGATSIVKLDAQIVFGVVSQQCASSGICKVFILPAQKAEANCNCSYQTLGQLLYDPKQKRLGLAFDFSFLQTREWQQFFSDFRFLLEEDWWTTPVINGYLGIAPLRIAKGTYPVFLRAAEIQVWFVEE